MLELVSSVSTAMISTRTIILSPAWLMNQLLVNLLSLIKFHIPWVTGFHLLVDVVEQVLVLFSLSCLHLALILLVWILIIDRYWRYLWRRLGPLLIPLGGGLLLLSLEVILCLTVLIEHAAIMMNVSSNLCNGSFLLNTVNALIIIGILIALIMNILLFFILLYITPSFLILWIVHFIICKFHPTDLIKVIWCLWLQSRSWRLLVNNINQGSVILLVEFCALILSDSNAAHYQRILVGWGHSDIILVSSLGIMVIIRFWEDGAAITREVCSTIVIEMLNFSGTSRIVLWRIIHGLEDDISLTSNHLRLKLVLGLLDGQLIGILLIELSEIVLIQLIYLIIVKEVIDLLQYYFTVLLLLHTTQTFVFL